MQFDANYSISTVTPSLISTTIMPILNSTALSNQTTALNTTVQTVTNSFSSASSEYFNRFILEIHKSDGIHDLGIIKWEMASKRTLITHNPVENFNRFNDFFSMSSYRVLNLLLLAMEGNQHKWKGKII